MKKCFPLLLLFLFCSTLDAQVVTDKQTTLISKRTADWCPLCGSYGWAFTNALKLKLVDKDAIFWNVHFSGGLQTPTSLAVANNLGGSGQPLFFLNTDSDDIGVTSANIQSKVAEVVQTIDDLSFLGSIVGMGAEATLSENNKLTANAKIKFYDSADAGEYYIAFYLVKKNLVWTQASVGPNAVHHSILDRSLTNSHFGNLVTKAPVAIDAEFSSSSSITDLVLHNGKLEDTKVVAVLWNKIPSGKFIFLNAREVDIATLSGTDDVIESKFDFTACSEGNVINIASKTPIPDGSSISIFDLTGKKVPFTLSKDSDTSINLQNIDARTSYLFVQIVNGKSVSTKKVFMN